MFGAEQFLSVFESIFLPLVSFECADLVVNSANGQAVTGSLSHQDTEAVSFQGPEVLGTELETKKAAFNNIPLLRREVLFSPCGSNLFPEVFRFRPNALLVIIIRSFISNDVMF